MISLMWDLKTSWTYTGFTLASHQTVKYFVFVCIYKVDELKSSPKMEKKQANFGKRLATILTTHWLYTDNNLTIKKSDDTLVIDWL